MLIDSLNSSLLLIDVQTKLFPKISDSEILENSILDCLEAFYTLDIPIFFSEQYPDGLGTTIDTVKDKLLYYKAHRFEKTSFSCFPNNSETQNLNQLFKSKQVILIGIETHICVLQTAMDLKKKGYEIFVIFEAVGSRKTHDKDFAIKRMINSGIQVITFEMMLFELLKDSKNKHFKSLSRLVK
jgi:hypothetical protein